MCVCMYIYIHRERDRQTDESHNCLRNHWLTQIDR